MARNKFGCICDICGSMHKNKNETYRLILPTYKSKWGNGLQYVDYCFPCYEKLKKLLYEYYVEEKNNGI